MKVKIISSWMHPIQGKIYPNGSILEIDKMYFSKTFHEEVKIKSKAK